MTLNYEYGDQGGYPYEYTGVTQGEETRPEYIGKIANNERSGYRRGLLNSGINIEYQARNFILSAVTGYQNLNDRMFLDQDFTEKDIYTLEQKQRANTIQKKSLSNQSREIIGNGPLEFPGFINGCILQDLYNSDRRESDPS